MNDQELSRELIEKYDELGYSGFILWHRDHHGGDDPDPKMLDQLVADHESRRRRGAGRWTLSLLKAIS